MYRLGRLSWGTALVLRVAGKIRDRRRPGEAGHTGKGQEKAEGNLQIAGKGQSGEVGAFSIEEHMVVVLIAARQTR